MCLSCEIYPASRLTLEHKRMRRTRQREIGASFPDSSLPDRFVLRRSRAWLEGESAYRLCEFPLLSIMVVQKSILISTQLVNSFLFSSQNMSGCCWRKWTNSCTIILKLMGWEICCLFTGKSLMSVLKSAALVLRNHITSTVKWTSLGEQSSLLMRNK